MTKNGCRQIEGGVWGRIVVVAAFLIQVITFGTSQSIGVYTVELLEYFDAGAAAISLVGSINIGLLLGAGPLASILMTRWSCRQVAMVGAVLANIGLITLPFAPNLQFMYVFYGVVTGLGYCLSYVSSHVLCGLYFYKQRGCATAIAAAGIGMGTTVFPIIAYYLIERYGWQGSLFILAGLNLHLFIFATLLRPVPKGLMLSFKILESSATQRKPEQSDTNGYSFPNNELEIETSEACSISVEHVDSADSSRHYDNNKTFIGVIPNQCEYGDSVPVKETQVESNITEIDIKNLGSLRDDDDGSVCSPVLTDDEFKQNNIFIKTIVKEYCLSVVTLDFSLYCLSCVFWNAGLGILLIFLPEYMLTIGINKKDSSLAVTFLGVGNFVGCITWGLLGNFNCCNRIILYIVGSICAGLETILMVWSYLHTFVSMLLLALLYGFMIGIILGLLLVVTSDLLGTDALVKGFGYLMFCNGFGMFSGPPLAGFLIDTTGHISRGIMLSAVLTLMGGIIFTIVPIKRRSAGHIN